MANDPPTTLRMGFGYHQARAAGLGGVRQSRSPRQVNNYIEDAKFTRELRRQVEIDPEWGQFVKYCIEEGRSAEDTLEALGRAKSYMSLKRRGYPFEYRLRWRP